VEVHLTVLVETLIEDLLVVPQEAVMAAAVLDF
jgi:hypothetical protein